MSSRRLLPNTHPNFSQRDVINSIGESSKWRNPFRVELKSGFPKELDQRQRDYEKIFGTQTEWVKKGRPL